jgi:hypothetical protein
MLLSLMPSTTDLTHCKKNRVLNSHETDLKHSFSRFPTELLLKKFSRCEKMKFRVLKGSWETKTLSAGRTNDLTKIDPQPWKPVPGARKS